MNVLRYIAAAGCAAALGAHADCFWSHIDHEVAYSDTGPWKTSTYRALSNALTVANLAGALWEGTESRLGRTMWEAAESQVLTEAVSIPAKPLFGRLRPAQAHDPCQWGHGSQGHSFPSEEAGVAAALVMPYVLEYGSERPWTYALLALPAYVGIGRIKNQAHWQTDVLAGWAIGGGFGWWEHRRDSPLVFSLLPGGAFVGFHRRF
ncbi:MAG TPA: phosphatase PAP2 family protein [Usitatibacter sp.]|jgi:undecaprenyl-diphosphatase|nr:phosphatase PAP2 family protein [Usitatibacter sp.]